MAVVQIKGMDDALYKALMARGGSKATAMCLSDTDTPIYRMKGNSRIVARFREHATQPKAIQGDDIVNWMT